MPEKPVFGGYIGTGVVRPETTFFFDWDDETVDCAVK
jgi:hypothetical protein